MATFTKLSLRRMVFMPIITLGLYFLDWLENTGNQLNKAGGSVPSSFIFLILPAVGAFILMPVYSLGKEQLLIGCFKNFYFMAEVGLSFYFWFRYTQAYVRVVKKSVSYRNFSYYFFMAILPRLLLIAWPYFFVTSFPVLLVKLGWTDWLRNLLGHKYLFWLMDFITLLFCYVINLMRMLIFQKGFNEYKE